MTENEAKAELRRLRYRIFKGCVALSLNVVALLYMLTALYDLWHGDDPFRSFVLSLLLGLTADNVDMED